MFGTDGIRGRFGDTPITPQGAYSLGYALASVAQELSIHNPSIVIGTDTRESGLSLSENFSAGFSNFGGGVTNLGVIPTGAIGWCTKEYPFDFGVAITASHNPCHDNGFKFFDRDGIKASDKTQTLIAKKYTQVKQEKTPTSPISSEGKQEARSYIKWLENEFSKIHMPKGAPVIECANGAGSFIANQILAPIGFQIDCASPDGSNINVECGAEYTSSWKEKLEKRNSNWAFVLDGDADRFVVISKKFGVIPGEILIAMYADAFGGKAPIGVSLGCNSGLKTYLENNLKTDVLVTPVGDRALAHALTNKHGIVGGEESGHYLFLDKHTTGDGLYSLARLLQNYSDLEDSLSAYLEKGIMLPEARTNISVKRKSLSEQDHANFEEEKKHLENKLQNSGRIVIRASGTEMKYRVIVEAEETQLAENLLASSTKLVNKYFC